MDPKELLQILQGTVAEATLQRVVRQLRADPAWLVAPPVEQPTVQIVQFVYQPQQVTYAFHALRVHPDRWHLVPQPPHASPRPE